MIDWMMHLPKDMDRLWEQDLQILEEEFKMPYVSSYERAGIERGLKQGLEQGLEQGIQKGQTKVLMRQLERRFGELPQWARDRLDSGSPDALEIWADAVLSAATIEAVFDISNH